MMSRLVREVRAKAMMSSINRTDKLDARGMNHLQRSGPLPTMRTLAATLAKSGSVLWWVRILPGRIYRKA